MGYYDSTFLKRLLQDHGQEELFPAQKNLHMIIREWKSIMKTIPGSLELVFQLFFPTHPLTRLHHWASVDAQKVCLLMGEYARMVG